ncbi:MAG: DUF6049 family protein [Ilumatobacteraceae bacterium]
MIRPRALLLAFVPVALAVPSSTSAAPAAFEAAPIGIVAQPFHVLTPVNARFTLRLPAAVPRTANVRFSLHRRVANRDSFRAIADHFAEPGVIDLVTVPVRRGVAGTSGTSFDVLLTTKDGARNDLFMPQEGIYPLSIDAVSADGALLGTTLTFLHRRAVETAVAVPVTVVAGLSAPVSLASDGQFALLDSARASVRSFVEFLRGVTGPVSVQVQPELVEALAQSTEEPDIELFAALSSALTGRRVALSPWVHADAAALVADGLASQVTEMLNLSSATFSRHLPGVVAQPSVWIARDSVDRETLTLLRNLGISTLVLLPAAVAGTEREASPSLLSRPAGSGNGAIAVLAADDAVSTTIDAAGDDPVRIGYRIAAETISLRDDLVASGAGPDAVRIVVSSSNGDLVDGPGLQTAVRALNAAPGIALREIGGPETVGPDTPATVFPASTGRTTGGLRSAMVQARRELDAVLSMLPEDDPRMVLWSELLAVAAAGGPEASGYVDGLRSELRRLTSSVSLATAPDITLSSRSGSIRLQLRNDETTPLYVRVTVTSPKITIGNRADVVELLPGSTTDVKVPISVRSNGAFPVNVRVTTPAGRVQVVSPTVITARVRAVTGLGQVVSITLLLVLLAWWWTSWRRKRTGGDPAGTVSGQ